MIDYYDYVLALIPLSLLGVTAGLWLVGFRPETALTGGSLTAAVVVGHAVFVNAPIDDERVQKTPTGFRRRRRAD